MTALCVIFAVIYEFLGHGVYSWRIRLLFLIPLVMFVFFVFLKWRSRKSDRWEAFLPAITTFRLLAASEIARNAFIGIVTVYGTASSKTIILYVLSAVLLFVTAVLTVYGGVKKAV
ncbi:MAG: hypothetical protein J6X47_00955 [Clostridia bacterium]|jgi:hypothetical protein|nr:hypothetical protein [Clostridia bacterium]